MGSNSTFRIFSNQNYKILIVLLFVIVVFGCKQKNGEYVACLKEVSAFQIGEESFIRGQVCICDKEPDSDVKAYPALKSDKPLYGSIRFAQEPGKENSGIQYYFVVDESKGTEKGYDRIYFDINQDFDLTNDIPVMPLISQPENAFLNYSTLKRQICFDYLNVSFDFGSDGQRPFEIMPRLMIYNSEYFNVDFVTTKARKGTIKIAGKKYKVLLGHAGAITGWFDRPLTALHLISKDQQDSWGGYWLEGQRLFAMHEINGFLYQFSATPSGDKLTAKPYKGPFGTFKIGTGHRDLTHIGCRGSLCSQDKAVSVSGEDKNQTLKTIQSCQLPVGDYLPSSLTIEFDNMTVNISDNYHKDGEPRSNIYGLKNYGIKIREDKPFVFDLSNKPEVMFALPAKDSRIGLGEQLMVKAILKDPELDIMIRHIYILADTNNPGGRRVSGKLYSFDPEVVVTRADGEIITEGTMPFG
jgi:hypothetical protein